MIQKTECDYGIMKSLGRDVSCFNAHLAKKMEYVGKLWANIEKNKKGLRSVLPLSPCFIW